MAAAILGVLSRGQLSAADWEEIEESLLIADLGLEATDSLMEALKRRVAVESTTDEARIREILREELLAVVGPDMDRSLDLTRPEADGTSKPAVVLMVGVTVPARRRPSVSSRASSSRRTSPSSWALLTRSAPPPPTSSPRGASAWASTLCEATEKVPTRHPSPRDCARGHCARRRRRLVDTAGRLQNKSTLMDELGKIKRVMEKQAPVSEVLLVLDATTGQNGMKQAEVFAQATGVTGIVLTKLAGLRRAASLSRSSGPWAFP